MSADDFKPGDRVLDNAFRPGTVMDDETKRAEHPGFVPIQWDAGARTMAMPEILTPIDSRSATPQAGRGQTAGTPTSPQDVPAPTAPRTLPNLIRRAAGLQERRTHDRADGPVVIDPDQKHRIVVKGDPR